MIDEQTQRAGGDDLGQQDLDLGLALGEPGLDLGLKADAFLSAQLRSPPSGKLNKKVGSSAPTSGTAAGQNPALDFTFQSSTVRPGLGIHRGLPALTVTQRVLDRSPREGGPTDIPGPPSALQPCGGAGCPGGPSPRAAPRFELWAALGGVRGAGRARPVRIG